MILESECYPGMKIGRLTLVHKVRIPKGNYTTGGWYCRCSCGNTTTVRTTALGKDTNSCGCYNRQHNLNSKRHSLRKKYGFSDSRKNSPYYKLYHTWLHIKERCYNNKSKSYGNYGGRGIKMCEEWKNNYNSFKKWSLEHGFNLATNPLDMTIDRIDVNGDYSPNNCRWIGMKVQANNKRNNIHFTINGQDYTPNEASKLFNIKASTIRYRYRKGIRGSDLIVPIYSRYDRKND